VLGNKQRLGKGLEALLPRTSLASGKTVINIPMSEITANPYQPRIKFEEDDIRQLSESIKQYGLMQPVLVRRKEGGGYELIAGERRFRACLLADMGTISAIIKNVSDKESLQLALIENLEREDLNPIEEALAYSRLLEEFGFTHQNLAGVFGKSRSVVTNTIRLLKLPEVVQSALVDGDISEGHARSLLSLEDEYEILEKFYTIKEKSLNVRQLEDEISFQKSNKAPKAKKSSLKQLSLFEGMEQELAQRYETKVSFSGTHKKGKIVIQYSSKKQLDDIVKKLKLTQ
jgi:ParB family transcriptional regulator, chromosome partitioning protein